MNGPFADRMRIARLAAAADLPRGAQLAVQLRDRLLQEGFSCDDVFADDDGWCFFVGTEQAPVGVTVAEARVNGVPAWQATAQYEGGLSSIWSESHARDGAQLAFRIQAILDVHFARLVAHSSPPGDAEPA